MPDGHTYQHKQFPVGTRVRISVAIRRKHFHSPIAGREGVATWGTYYVALLRLDPQQQKMVPVEIDGQVYLVEPEFVSKL